MMDRPSYEIRRRSNARRLTLRVRQDSGAITVTAPDWVPDQAIHDFVDRRRDWIDEHLATVPDPVPFVDGGIVPIQGVDHRITATGKLRGVVTRENGVLLVPGDPDRLTNRVTDYLASEARRIFGALCHEKAGQIGKRVTGLAIRDQRTRWGSCTENGRIALNWRLVLAPDWVADYVIAHEVAHLQHLDHSSAFWALCARLTSVEVSAARKWLNANGTRLHRYGALPS